jgi:hypothetical protein
LPDQYKLLRRKLFRIPQWTSSSDSSDSDSDTDDNNNNNKKPVVQDLADRPTKLLHNSSSSHANSNNATHNAALSRSRSLSVSLEQEAAGLRRTESKPRRVLQREVSMSKVFKGRRNDGTNMAPPVKIEVEATASSSSTSTTTQAQVKGPIVLVQGTPQKPKAKSKSA